MENYKPNSHKYKEEQKRISMEQKSKKVINGQVTTKKKTGFQKFTSNIVNEDMPKVKEYILSDVLIPSIKKAISDIVRNGIDMLLYGEAGRNRDSRTQGSKISYTKYYNNPIGGVGSGKDNYSRSSVFDFDDIILSSRGDAELVLNLMDETISKYGFVKVADLYDFVGITTNNHCANSYGWTDLRSARITGVRDGYVLNLPKALPID